MESDPAEISLHGGLSAEEIILREEVLVMEVTVIRSNRRTVSIQVNADLTVTVRAPLSATKKEIEQLLKEKEGWIRRHREIMAQKKAACEAAARGILILTVC